jgi:hypothetical protein
MRISYDYSKRYCNICEIVIDRTDMDRHKASKKHNLNYMIDQKMNHLIPTLVFEPASIYIPSSTATQAT